MASPSPLKADGSEIRLLDLQPGKMADEIRCTRRKVTFDHKPKFEALSYVWGDPKNTRPVIVDEQPFQATTRKTRVLWVDAICINQDDVNEKGVQVGRMYLIYSRAYRVLTWLGPSSSNVQVADSWMRIYASGWPFGFFKSWYWLSINTRALFSVRAEFERHLALLRAYVGYVEFFGNPYWSRMWTFQEYCLGGPRQLSLFGGREVKHTNWDIGIPGLLNDKSLRALNEIKKLAISPRGRKFIKSHPGWWRSLRAQMEVLGTQVGSLRDMNATVHHFSSVSAENRTVMSLIFQTSQHECFHPHDRIYALYGLCPELANKYPVDYTKPYRQVMLETADYILNNDPMGVRMFSILGLRDGHLSDNSYPSWLPEFSQQTGVPPLLSMGGLVDSIYDGYQGLSNKVTADLRVLHVLGRTLGRCKVTYRFSTEGEACAAQIRQLWLEPSRLLGFDDANSNTLRNSENLKARLVYACVLHRYEYTLKGRDEEFSRIRTSLDEWSQIQLTFRRILQEMNLEGKPRYGIVYDSVSRLKGMALIVTESGFFGMASQHVRDGDLVVLPQNAIHPFILTTQEEDSSEQPDVYKLVGIAYIDGLFKGEFEDGDAISEILEQQYLREFRIR